MSVGYHRSTGNAGYSHTLQSVEYRPLNVSFALSNYGPLIGSWMLDVRCWMFSCDSVYRAGKAGTCPRSPKPRRALDYGGRTPLLLHAWLAPRG